MLKRLVVFAFAAAALGWGGGIYFAGKDAPLDGRVAPPPPADEDNAAFENRVYPQRPGADFDATLEIVNVRRAVQSAEPDSGPGSEPAAESIAGAGGGVDAGTEGRAPVRAGFDPFALFAGRGAAGSGAHAAAGIPDAARLFFDVADDDNYLAAEVRADGRCRILHVEDGALRVLAEARLAGGALHPAGLRLRRRAPQIELVVDRRLVLRAVHEGHPGGRLGAGARGWSVERPRVQPVMPVLFTDDFMRTADESDAWVAVGRAEWEVRSDANPGRSANAFVYQGRGRPAENGDAGAGAGLSLTGADYWDGYHVEVAVNPTPEAAVGLVLSSDAPAPASASAPAGEVGARPSSSSPPARYALVRWVGGAIADETLRRASAKEPLRFQPAPVVPPASEAESARPEKSEKKVTPAADKPAPTTTAAMAATAANPEKKTEKKTENGDASPSEGAAEKIEAEREAQRLAQAAEAARAAQVAEISRRLDSPSDDEPLPGRFEIVEVLDGVERVLASVPGGFRPGRWYRLHAALNRGAIRAGVDGVELLAAESPWFSGGQAGLYVQSGKAVEFDDFKVVSLDALSSESFRTQVPANAAAASAASAGADDNQNAAGVLRVRHDLGRLGWRPYGGEWQSAGDGSALRVQNLDHLDRLVRSGGAPATPMDGPRALAVAGLDEEADFDLRAEVESPGPGIGAGVGLVASFRDPGNYVALEFDPARGRVGLVRMAAGRREVLAEGPPPEGFVGPGDCVRLELRVDRGHLSGAGLDAFVPESRPGRVGLLAFDANANAAAARPSAPSAPAASGQGEIPAAAEIARGRAGAQAVFRSFAAVPIDAPLPPPARNEMYDGEDLMAIWSGPEGEWYGGAVKRENAPFDTSYWHRGLFFRDVEMEAALPDDWDGQGRLALSLAKPRGATASNGYYCLLEPAPEAKPAAEAEPDGNENAASTGKTEENAEPAKAEAKVEAEVRPLVIRFVRENREIARHTLAPGELPRRFNFRLAGPILVAQIDGRAVLVHRDPEPLAGEKVAWASKDMAMEPARVQVLSRAYLDYSFNEAPVDWRVGGGVWEVTNRWECDPRWNFMTGMPPALATRRADTYERQNTAVSRWKAEALRELVRLAPDPNAPLAALWHKRPLAGDFCVETFMVQVMDGSKGDYGEFVKNFNLTVCGDGRDLSRGYACVFGGWGNKKSAILRNGAVVAEVPRGIPVRGQNLHRQWFRLRVERQGDTIRFQAFTQRGRDRAEDELLRLVYRDPDPLPGGRVAIWSHDNGIAVARTRLAAEIIGPAEHPLSAPPGASAVFYD